MLRPKSAGDAHGLGKEDEPFVPEPVASPTKGILMTPGTAAARRKTVTFGDHVADNQDKRPLKSGLPDDCPGKFPSPWAKPGASEEKDDDEPADKGRGRSKLTEALEQVRDESARRKRSDKRVKVTNDDDFHKEHADPKSESGKYWKTQYDVYRENSQREVRKLIAKQKMAKSFAKDKDFQCTELADQLRQEQKKVAKLEKRTAELELKLRGMQAQLSDRQALEQEPPAEVVELAAKPSYRGERPKDTRSAGPQGPSQQPSAVQRTAPRPADSQPTTKQVPNDTRVEATKSTERQQPSATIEQPNAEPEPQKARTKARPVNIRTKSGDDVWDQSFGSSTQVLSRSAEKPPVSPNPGRTVTSGTGATPLKSLSINTLQAGKLTRRDSTQPSPPSDRFAKEPLVRQEVLPPRPEEKQKDSPVLSAGLPQPVPETQPTVRREVPIAPDQRKTAATDATDDLSIPVPVSSPFEPNPAFSPPTAETKRSYFDRREQAAAKASGSPVAKENVAPTIKARPTQLDNVKPTAAWTAISAPPPSKRVASMTDKTGKEVGLDRIEAAKARLVARGRNVS